MQLHPFYATISRPIYQDRCGYLYEPCDCPTCKGDGQQLEGSLNPSVRDRWVECEDCGGSGYVMTEVFEEDLISNEEKAA